MQDGSELKVSISLLFYTHFVQLLERSVVFNNYYTKNNICNNIKLFFNNNKSVKKIDKQIKQCRPFQVGLPKHSLLLYNLYWLTSCFCNKLKSTDYFQMISLHFIQTISRTRMQHSEVSPTGMWAAFWKFHFPYLAVTTLMLLKPEETIFGKALIGAEE